MGNETFYWDGLIMILNSLFLINLSYLFIYLIYQFILYIYLFLFIYLLFSTVRRPPSAVRIHRPFPHFTDSPSRDKYSWFLSVFFVFVGRAKFQFSVLLLL